MRQGDLLRSYRYIRSFLLALVLTGLAASFTFGEERTAIKVGIYHNPPTVFVDDRGIPQGLYVDILNEITARENWEVKYFINTWPVLFEKLKKGEIDLLTAIAYSDERDTFFDFSEESFVEKRGVVYARKDAPIQAMSELEGRRVVLVKEDIHAGFFKEIVDLFGIDVELEEVGSYQEVLERINDRKADVGVVNNAFGAFHEALYELQRTPIYFRPIPLVVAFPEGRHNIIRDRIDAYLRQWKKDRSSPYQASYERWLGGPAGELPLTPEERIWLAGHKSIRVAFDGYFPPYSFLNESGEFEGFAVDVLRTLAQRIGIELEISPKVKWKELYEAAQRHEIDVVATMVKRPERKEWFAFTQPYIFKSLVIMTRGDYFGIQHREDLAGKRVALVKEYQYVKRILEESPSLKPYYVDTMLDALNAVSTGKADAAITFLGGGHYLRSRYLLANLKFAAIYDRDSSIESVGVRKDWPVLADIFDKALKSLSAEERLSLAQKWLPSEAFAEEKEPIELTAEERAWIRGHPDIRLGIDPEFAPFEYLDDEGRYGGIASDYIELLNERLGLNMHVVPGIAWKEAVEKAKHKEIDILPCVGLTEERRKFFAYSAPYIQFHRVIITQSETPFITGLEDISDWKVAVQADSSHEGYLKDHSDIEPMTFPTLQEALTAVSDGKAEAIVGNVAASTYWIRKTNLTNLKIAAPVSQQRQKLYFAIRDDWPILARIINKGLASVSDEETSLIQQRWVQVEYAPGIARRTVIKYIIQIIAVSVLILIAILVRNLELKRDVSKRKRIEQELEVAKDAAEAANRTKSAFLASMSHELRTPLNSIIGFNGIILNEMAGPLNFEQKKQLRMVQGSSKHLLNLINDVLDISKIEAGELEVSFDTFNMRDMVERVRQTLAPMAERKELTLSTEIEPGVGEINSDQRRIEQVLINLVNNAIKFTDVGEVEITCRVMGDRIETAVADTGIGIREKEVGQLFKPFRQLDSGISRKYEGTGLGLSICKHILDMLGGRIGVKSRYGKGSTFTFDLPMQQESRNA